MEKVRRKGGKINVFSSAHGSGEKLNDLTGVACILRYPILIELEDDDDDEEEEEV